MTLTKDGAYLVHISDTVTAMAAQLEEQKEVQQNMLAVLGQLLETNEAQSEMLAEIMGSAAQDAGPSPVAHVLEVLAARILAMDENQAALMAHLMELPDAIGKQFELSLTNWSATSAATH